MIWTDQGPMFMKEGTLDEENKGEQWITTEDWKRLLDAVRKRREKGGI